MFVEMFRLEKARREQMPKHPLSESRSLETKVHAFPAVSANLAELEAARSQLHYLELVFLCRDLLSSELAQIGAETNKGHSTIGSHEGTGAEGFACLAVGELIGDFHAAVRLCEVNEGARGFDAYL